jgi:hypothetical protein
MGVVSQKYTNGSSIPSLFLHHQEGTVLPDDTVNMKVSSHKEDFLVLVALLAEKDRFVFM